MIRAGVVVVILVLMLATMVRGPEAYPLTMILGGLLGAWIGVLRLIGKPAPTSRTGAGPKPKRRRCAHEAVVPVELELTGELVARWCPTCSTQLDVDGLFAPDPLKELR